MTYKTYKTCILASFIPNHFLDKGARFKEPLLELIRFFAIVLHQTRFGVGGYNFYDIKAYTLPSHMLPPTTCYHQIQTAVNYLPSQKWNYIQYFQRIQSSLCSKTRGSSNSHESLLRISGLCHRWVVPRTIKSLHLKLSKTELGFAMYRLSLSHIDERIKSNRKLQMIFFLVLYSNRYICSNSRTFSSGSRCGFAPIIQCKHISHCETEGQITLWYFWKAEANSALVPPFEIIYFNFNFLHSCLKIFFNLILPHFNILWYHNTTI